MTSTYYLISISFDEMYKFTASKFDYSGLEDCAYLATVNLNNVIDINYYPTPQTRRSNLSHRPIGIGVQGLADTFALMDFNFDSEESKLLNKQIFETIYHAAIETSHDLAKERKAGMIAIREGLDNDRIGFSDYNDPCCQEIIKPHVEENKFDIPKLYEQLISKYRPTYYETLKLKEKHLGAYSSFENSPISNKKFQFDLWGVEPSNRYDWEKLRNDIQEDGIRNS